MPVYLSTARTTRATHSMDNIIDLILDLLKKSINVNGKIEFNFSLDNLVGAIVRLDDIEASQTIEKELCEISQIIDETMQLQRIFSSKNELIRGACIAALLKLRSNNLTCDSGQIFSKYVTVVKYGSLRIKASECLSLLSTFAQNNSALQVTGTVIKEKNEIKTKSVTVPTQRRGSEKGLMFPKLLRMYKFLYNFCAYCFCHPMTTGILSSNQAFYLEQYFNLRNTIYKNIFDNNKNNILVRLSNINYFRCYYMQDDTLLHRVPYGNHLNYASSLLRDGVNVNKSDRHPSHTVYNPLTIANKNSNSLLKPIFAV